MMDEENFFNCTMEGKVALVTIDRPPLNILRFDYYKELCETMIDLIETKQAKVVVLTGSNQVFISGLDINEIGRIEIPAENTRKTMAIKVLFRRIEMLKRPIIAAINGNCFGGGLELAMACHMRLASQDAKLGLPEITLGTISSFGGTQRLPRIIGLSKSLELMLTGKPISGEEAYRIGLVNEVCAPERLLDRTLSLAHEIEDRNMMAVEVIVQAATEGLEQEVEKGMELESELSSTLTGTYNMKEGVSAFLEKRKPVFHEP
jgi:enoyl-CoA hydratase/carnithine racemase